MKNLLDKEMKRASNKPVLGVSACLLGNRVRFDGGHKANSFVSTELKDFVEYIAVCPEVEAGFSTPRPAMQLRLNEKEIQMVISNNNEMDVSQQMRDFSKKRLNELSELDGFIFKKNSPSCGVYRVPLVVSKHEHRKKVATGLFAQAFIERYPLIPVEEEGRLNDPELRENFMERVFAYQRWKGMENSFHGLVDFHTRHELMLMARGRQFYQELGRMLAATRETELNLVRNIYIYRFMEVMALIPSPGRHVNVLQHVLGYLKTVLNHEDKNALLGVFESYRHRKIPLITPVTLLRHYLRVYRLPYIERQHYFTPFPEQLALGSFFCRNKKIF